VLRAVLDTNVIVSGVISRKGAPVELLDAWRQRQFLLLSSPTIIAEVIAVLRYPRILKKYPLSDEEINRIINLLEHDALLVSGNVEVAGDLPADPHDEKFLTCALDGQADVIVSGDHHLLDLKVYQGIKVCAPRQFLEQLNEVPGSHV
jgi:putative PIN family toxin of toxin-antitoxin system